MASALRLTAEQRARIRTIEEETFCEGPPGRPDEPPDHFRRTDSQDVSKALGQILALLMPEQLQRWQEMTGEPFKGSLRMRPFKPNGPPPFRGKGPPNRGKGPPR